MVRTSPPFYPPFLYSACVIDSVKAWNPPSVPPRMAVTAPLRANSSIQDHLGPTVQTIDLQDLAVEPTATASSSTSRLQSLQTSSIQTRFCNSERKQLFLFRLLHLTPPRCFSGLAMLRREPKQSMTPSHYQLPPSIQPKSSNGLEMSRKTLRSSMKLGTVISRISDSCLPALSTKPVAAFLAPWVLLFLVLLPPLCLQLPWCLRLPSHQLRQLPQSHLSCHQRVELLVDRLLVSWAYLALLLLGSLLLYKGVDLEIDIGVGEVLGRID